MVKSLPDATCLFTTLILLTAVQKMMFGTNTCQAASTGALSRTIGEHKLQRLLLKQDRSPDASTLFREKRADEKRREKGLRKK